MQMGFMRYPILVLTKDLNSIFTTFRILKGIRLDKTVNYIPINVTFSPHHFQNTLKNKNEEIVFVATATRLDNADLAYTVIVT
jgi:hypothetical protein